MTVEPLELSALARSHDIISLGVLADEERRRRHGTRTTFLRVVTLSADPDAPIHVPDTAGEVRISGVPASPAAAWARVKAVAAVAGRVPVSAYSLADLEGLAARAGMTLRSLLEGLRDVGAELIADAPFDILHDPRRAIEETNIAGLTLARLTISRASDDPLATFAAVSALQREVAVIRAFAPLPRASNPAAPTTGFDDVKRVALARLAIDNIASIQVDWAVYGAKLAQVALTMGGDDLDGVPTEDDLSEGPRRTTRAEVERNIRAAGQEPIERNARFDSLQG